MARKQSNSLLIAGIVAASLAAFGLIGGGVYLFLSKADSFANLTAFPIDSYMNGGNLWSYDVYKLEGRVDNVIFRSHQDDLLVASVQPAGSRLRLPVVIQRGKGVKPVQLEQELVLKVTVGDAQKILCSEYASRARR